MPGRTHQKLGPRDPEAAKAHYERLTPDERVALLVARDASIRVINELRKEAIEAGLSDALTGRLNRRGLNQEYLRAGRRYQRQAESAKPDLLLMVDLDDFKKINDTAGHLQGDRTLQKVAGLIGATVRGGDAVGRCGGDEFVAFLYGATIEEGTVVANRMTANVNILKDQERSSANPAVIPTLSIGLAEIDYLLPFEEAMDLADTALYEAKRAGKDQVHILQPH